MDVRCRGTGEWILVKHGWDIRMSVAYHRFTRGRFELGGVPSVTNGKRHRLEIVAKLVEDRGLCRVLLVALRQNP